MLNFFNEKNILLYIIRYKYNEFFIRIVFH